MTEKFLVIAPNASWAAWEMRDRGIAPHRWIYVHDPQQLRGRRGCRYFLFGWPQGLNEFRIREMMHYLLMLIQVADFREEAL